MDKLAEEIYRNKLIEKGIISENAYDAVIQAMQSYHEAKMTMKYDIQAELLYRLIKKQKRYNNYLLKTIKVFAPWFGDEINDKFRSEIIALEKQIKEQDALAEKIKNTDYMDAEQEEKKQIYPEFGGWECPRCHKIHSWMSTECDCPPQTITSTSYDGTTQTFK